jgi:hypothetical protein
VVARRLRIGGEQPTRDLDAGGLGIALADQAPLAVALHLAELIAIDGGVEGRARLFATASAGERTQQSVEHHCRQNGKDRPEQHLGTSLCPGRLAIGERREGGKHLDEIGAMGGNLGLAPKAGRQRAE